MKNNEKTLARQQKPQQTLALCPLVAAAPEQHLSHYTDAKLRLIDFIIELTRKWRIVIPSQQWIADQIGVSREYANHLLGELADDGIIAKESRGTWLTLRYTVNEFFYQPHIRRKLAHILPSILTLVVFPLFMLVSRSGSSSSHYLRNSYFDYISIANSYIYIPTILSSKKDLVMNKSLPTVKGLNLTRYGKIKLCVYPQEAIAYAEAELAKATDIRSPLGFVHSKCKEWCMKQGRKIEWKNKYQFIEPGETFRENEPELESTSTLKASSTYTPSAKKEFQQEKYRGPKEETREEIRNRDVVDEYLNVERYRTSEKGIKTLSLIKGIIASHNPFRSDLIEKLKSYTVSDYTILWNRLSESDQQLLLPLLKEIRSQ